MLNLRLRNFFNGFDWWLVAAVFLLTCFGLAALYSVDLGRPDSNMVDFRKQIIFFIFGFVLMLVAGKTNYAFFRSFSGSLYIICLLLLLVVLLAGTVIHGTKGWFVFGGVSFQPVEFAKASVILILALLASRQARSFKTLGFFLSSAFLVLVPSLLIMAQPDFGSDTVIWFIWFAFILLAGVKKRYIAILIFGALTLFSVAWFVFFKDYQKERFLTFLNPARDPFGRGYNVTQSMIAVGSGNFFGRGLGFGSQSQLRFLPENQTDFIISVVGEELGFVGTSLVVGLYFLLFYRLYRIASTVHDDFSLFTIIGIWALFFVQFLINVGMNIGLLPVTGITLPFMSAGGSSLIVNFFLIGIAQSISRAR